MLEPVATITAPLIGVFPSVPRDPEKAQLQKDIVPAVAKSGGITEETLKQALAKTLKTLPSDSYAEKAAYVYYEDEYESDVASEAYSSASSTLNGESPPTSIANTSVTTDVVGFFNNFTGKVKDQVKSPFSKSHAFLEKVLKLLSKEKHKIEDAFAVFDKLSSYLKDREYEKLPDFGDLCDRVPSLRGNLERMEEVLNSIKDEFKDKSIYQRQDKDVSPQEKQAYLDKRDRVEKGLASLKPVIEDLDNIIGILKEGENSDKQTFTVRVVTGILTFAGYILTLGASAGLTTISGTPVFLVGFFINMGVDIHQYQLKQDIKKWSSFKTTLNDLTKKNPLVAEDEVINGLLADQHRTQTQLIRSVSSLQSDNQTLAEMDQKLITSVSNLQADNTKIGQTQTQLINTVNQLQTRAENAEKKLEVVEAKLDSILRLLEANQTIMSKA